jgi:hypothetical protein
MKNEGAHGDVLLAVDILIQHVREFEWIEEGKGYREFLVPAAVLNTHARVRVKERDPSRLM